MKAQPPSGNQSSSEDAPSFLRLKGLFYGSAAEAWTAKTSVKRLAIDGYLPDDVTAVRATQQKHGPLARELQQSEADRQKGMQASWDLWQKNQRLKRRQFLAKHAAAKINKQEFIEQIAWKILTMVLQLHETGYDAASKDYKAIDDSLRCSQRLSIVCSAIEQLAIIRLDVLRGDRIHELIANPMRVARNKTEYFRNNSGRRDNLIAKGHQKKPRVYAPKVKADVKHDRRALTESELRRRTRNLEKSGTTQFVLASEDLQVDGEQGFGNEKDGDDQESSEKTSEDSELDIAGGTIEPEESEWEGFSDQESVASGAAQQGGAEASDSSVGLGRDLGDAEDEGANLGD